MWGLMQELHVLIAENKYLSTNLHGIFEVSSCKSLSVRSGFFSKAN